ncbi:MAG TPA: DUF4190 domain-containing protein [Pseudonocardia sp.]|jgi:hypothetical protein|nr:DUF4190 domain-containing protein [Pseudonocardia sp.]
MTESRRPRGAAPGGKPGIRLRRARTPPGIPTDAYPPQAYPPGYPVPTAVRAGGPNRLAVASLVCGLLGVTVLWLIGGGLALYFGYRARKQIARKGQRGRGLALTGIVLGWVGIAASVVLLALWLLPPTATP